MQKEYESRKTKDGIAEDCGGSSHRHRDHWHCCGAVGREEKGADQKMNEEKMITLETEDGERVDFYVLEETRINGTNYLLVTDSEEDDEEGECYILKDQSKAEDADALYEFVEDDEEMDYLYKIFAELMDDMDVDLEK